MKETFQNCSSLAQLYSRKPHFRCRITPPTNSLLPNVIPEYIDCVVVLENNNVNRYISSYRLELFYNLKAYMPKKLFFELENWENSVFTIEDLAIMYIYDLLLTNGYNQLGVIKFGKLPPLMKALTKLRG